MYALSFVGSGSIKTLPRQRTHTKKYKKYRTRCFLWSPHLAKENWTVSSSQSLLFVYYNACTLFGQAMLLSDRIFRTGKSTSFFPRLSLFRYRYINCPWHADWQHCYFLATLESIAIQNAYHRYLFPFLWMRPTILKAALLRTCQHNKLSPLATFH
jgi:hypothetical protein